MKINENYDSNYIRKYVEDNFSEKAIIKQLKYCIHKKYSREIINEKNDFSYSNAN